MHNNFVIPCLTFFSDGISEATGGTDLEGFLTQFPWRPGAGNSQTNTTVGPHVGLWMDFMLCVSPLLFPSLPNKKAFSVTLKGTSYRQAQGVCTSPLDTCVGEKINVCVFFPVVLVVRF